MVDALGGHTAAQNTLGAEGLRDGDALSSTTLSNLLQGLRGNGIVRLQDTAYGSTRNAVNTQPGAVTRASSHTLTVQGGYAVLDGVLYEFAGGPGGTATVTIGTHGTGTALAAATEQSMYSVYIASQGGQAKIHVDGGSPVNTTTGLYPQLPTQFLIDYDTGGSILNDQIVVLATLRCSYSGGGGSHKVDVQEVNDKRIFTRSNPIYMTPLSSGTIVTDGSELSQISRGATEGINTAAQLNALFSGNEAGSLGTNANGSVKIDVGALWMSTGRSGASIGYGPGDGIDRGSNRMMDDLFFAGQENSEVGVVTKRLFTEGVAAPTGTLSTASYTISSHGDKWFIFAPANSATITLNPEKSGSTYLFPEGHVIEVCNSAAANGGNIVFDSTGLNTTLLPDQRATFIFEGSTWLRCDYQAAISTLAFTTLTDTPSSLGTAGQHIRVNSGGNALEFIDSPTLTTEAVQDIIGDMVSGNTETNIAVTYVDGGVGVGKLNFVVAEQRTDAQVNDLAGALFTGNTETFITATYQTSDDTVDLVVPVHDEDNMSSDSATHLATQQSIKAYVDTSVAGVIDSAPGALDTLNELAAAINDDASFHTTVTTALTNRVRVDTASQGLTNTQKSNARTNMGLGTVSTLSAIDISSNTNLSASSPLTLTGDTLSIDDIPFSSLHADAVQISSESFADNDTTLMTSASIQDKILSYGYSTTTGTVTSVATGTGLTGGAITGSGTLSLSHLGLESLSDPNADKILFWDDSAGTLLWLLPGSNLSISGTTLAATNTNQLTTFTIRDDDDDAKTIEQGKFIKFVSATGTAGTNWAGAGTTGDPFVMTITNPDTQLTGAQVKDFAGAMFTGNTETFITATYQTGDDTVDLVVPVHDEDNMASNSATHLATQQSIKAYVDTEVSGLIDSAPGALDTLNELAAAINDDASFHTTMTTALAARLRVDTASQGLTGTQQSNARTNLGLGSMALLSSIDISDNTNLAAGTGIDLAGDTVSVDVSDFMSGGSNNRVLTAAGTDTFQGEANLTYDGTQLSAIGDTNDKDVLLIGNTAGNSGSTAGITHLGLSHWDSGTYPSTRITATEDAAGSYLGSLSFSTRGAASDSAATERMRILSDGKVGIGTTAPLSKFHIEKTAYDYDTTVTDGDLHLMLKATETSAAGDAVSIGFAQSGNTDPGAVGAKISHVVSGSWSAGDLTFSTNANTGSGGDNTTEKMRITSAGRVGIGTTSPEYELDLVGGLRVLPTIASHAGTAIRIGPQDNDIDVTLLRVDGNGGGAGIGNSGESNNSNYGYSIKYMGSGAGVNNRYALFMDNQAGTAFEAMTVLQDGKVGISDSTPSYHLDVAGDINLTGTLRQNGNAITTYNLYDNEITLSAGTGLTGGGAFTLNQNSDETLTFNVAGLTVSELAANSLQLSSESFADNDTSLMTSAAIQDKIESYGYSTTTGDITNVSAGVGLSGGGGSGSVTLTLDMSELPDMTQAVASSEDELIILDNGADKRKLISEIPLSAFNNDSSFITSSISSDFTITDSTLKLHNDTAAESLNHGDVLSTILFEKHSNGNDTIKIYNTSGDDSGGHDYHSSDLRISTRPRSGSLTDRFTIVGHTGNVGIGTTAPDYTLDVAGNIGVDNIIYHNGDGNTYLNFQDDDFRIVVGNDLAFHYDESGSSVMHLSYNGEADVKIGNGDFFFGGSQGSYDGKMAIGSSTPRATLDVTATNNPTILLNARDAGYAAGDKIGSLLFYNNEDSSGETGSRVGAGVRFVATDAYGRGNLELTSGTSDPMGSYNAAEVYTDNSIARLKINSDTGHIYLPTDAQKLYFGADSDMFINHSGSEGLIQNDTGLLNIDGQTGIYADVNGSNIFRIMSDHVGSWRDFRMWSQTKVRFYDADTSNYVALQSPDTVSSDLTWKLPAADGSNGQVLKTDGSGNLSFAAASSGSVSAVANGANNRIATFSSADALNGEANLQFDGSELDLVGRLHIDRNVDSATDTTASAGIFIDYDTTGTNTPGQDNEHYAIYIDQDNSSTAGDAANAEIEMAGIYIDQRQSGDANRQYAFQSYQEYEPSTAQTIHSLRGLHTSVNSHMTHASATLSNLYGHYSDVRIAKNGVNTNSYAEYNYIEVNNDRESDVGAVYGSYNQVDIEGSNSNSISTGYVYGGRYTIDHNDDSVTTATGYLMYLDWQGAANVTNPWGLYVTGETKNYISGNVGVGTTSATAKLHVNTSGDTDAFRVDVDSSDDPDSSPFVIAEDGRVGIGTASPRSDMALTLNGDGTSYEGISFDVGGSQKWKMSTDSTSMYVDAGANGMDWTFRLRDAAGTLRPQFRLDGGAQAVIIGDDGDGDSDPGPAMNRLQVNVGSNSGIQDGNDGIVIVCNDASIAQNNVLGGLGFDTRDGNVPSGVREASVALVAKAREDHGTGDKGGYLDFYYSPTDQNDDTTGRIGMRFLDGKLSVGGSASDVGDPINSLVVEHTGADWHNGMLILRDDSSISSGDLLGAIGFDGKDGNNPSNILEASAGIAAYATEDHSTGDKGGSLAIFTSAINDDDDTTSHERMRITSEGNVGIGTNNPETILHLETSSGQIAQLGTGNSAYSMHFADDRAMFGHVGGFATVQGGSGGKAVRFCVNNGTFGSGEVARFDTSGNFGLGDTSPSFASGIGMEITHATQANLRVTDSSASASSDFAQSDNDLYIVNRKSSGDIKIRVNGSDELLTLDGGTERVTQAKTTFSGNVTTTSSTNYNLYFPLYWQRDNMGTSNIDMRLPVGGDASTNPNNFAMPRAGKIMGFTVHYYGGSISTSSSVTDTWRARVHSGGTMDSSTLDTVVAHDTLTQSVNANNLVKTVEFGSPLAFSANDSVGFRRNANASSTLHEVNAVMWILFDE